MTNSPPRNIEDGQSVSGSVNAVQRVGDTVIRPVGPWSKSVHQLLNHLESVDFLYLPRAIALEQNKEFLAYIEGDVAMRPWPSCLLAESGIVAVAQMLLRYHQSVASYVPAPNSLWRMSGVQWKESMIVRHGDLGPWNMVWRSEQLVGLIDWDFAEPGYPIEDLAQIDWDCVPLYPPQKSNQAGIAPSEQLPRLKLLCEAYGADIDRVIDKVVQMQTREFFRLKSIGTLGKEPWLSWVKSGGLQNIASASHWLYETYSPNVQQPDLC